MAGARSAPPVTSVTTSSFRSLLAGEEQLAAARDVLAALPAPIVYTLRDQLTSPAPAVDRLFEVLQDGSFEVPDGPLGAPSSIIGATARAAAQFKTPAEMWHAMRSAIHTGSTPAAPSAPASSVGVAAGPPMEASTPEVSSLAEAERILGGPVPPSQVAWWEAALRFLLGASEVR